MSEARQIPKALSPGEEAFALHCRAEKLSPIAEYVFHPSRKWRLDFYFPESKIGVEIEGGRFGRHQQPKGFEEDCRKYAEAALLGITILRFTTPMAMRGEAIDYVLAALAGRAVAGREAGQ